MGFTPYVTTVGNATVPLSIANGGTGAATLNGAGLWTQQAATAAAGYALVNGTGNIITWTTPNDGALHRVLVICNINVTSLETGGQINVSVTYPDASTFSGQLLAPALSAATHQATPAGFVVEANTVVSVLQNTALTGGAAKLWAEIWGQ